ncbi:MAG: DUF1501 domain-containing protein [Planctomycetaceae bacterium]|nr:DUF1501 domain-containing protein [Planctomycetaceae bacterium]
MTFPLETSRRRFLQTGAAVSAYAFPSLLKARAESSAPARAAAPPKRVIVIFLQGGLSHMDSWDLKPEAPSEYRGEFRPISTSVAGFQISEHMPKLAARAHQYNVIRSCWHGTPSHEAAIHWTLTGYDYPGANTTTKNRNVKPSVGSIVSKVLGPSRPGLPAYVCVPDRGQLGDRVRYAAAFNLGMAHDPFESGKVPTSADEPFPAPPNLSLAKGVDLTRMDDRLSLLKGLDHLPRDLDASGAMAGMDTFSQKAVEFLAHDVTRKAFDFSAESLETRQRYGGTNFGHRLLLGRRLAEAGVPFTLVNFSNNQEWDTHTDNFTQMKRTRLPELDAAVSALLDDLEDRGLLDSTLVALYGEFGRTPKINNNAGRDHWSNVFSVMLTGGGLKRGQVLGTSTANGENPNDRPVHFNDVLATIYQQMGIPTDRVFPDAFGRPIPILYEGRPIPELT